MQFSVYDAQTVAKQRERERIEFMRINAMLRDAYSSAPIVREPGLIARFFRNRFDHRRSLETCETCAAA
jgi:hypothetical protein